MKSFVASLFLFGIINSSVNGAYPVGNNIQCGALRSFCKSYNEQIVTYNGINDEFENGQHVDSFNRTDINEEFFYSIGYICVVVLESSDDLACRATIPVKQFCKDNYVRTIDNSLVGGNKPVYSNSDPWQTSSTTTNFMCSLLLEDKNQPPKPVTKMPFIN